MSDQEGKAISQMESPREVDRIRDIIFGPQMHDYDQRFQVVQRDLDRLQGELERLTRQLAEQDAEQGRGLQELRQEMRQADGDLRDELRETAQQLMHDKVDRGVLGDLFIELGNSLKTGGSFADLLGALEEAQQD